MIHKSIYLTDIDNKRLKLLSNLEGETETAIIRKAFREYYEDHEKKANIEDLLN